MNAAQLIVLWYAGLLIAGLLLFRALDAGVLYALDAGVLYAIVAIALLAALAIYTLKPHPARKRWVVVGLLLPPMLLGVAFWGYRQHAQRVATERQAAEEAEGRAARAVEEVQQRAARAAGEARKQATEVRTALGMESFWALPKDSDRIDVLKSLDTLFANLSPEAQQLLLDKKRPKGVAERIPPQSAQGEANGK